MEDQVILPVTAIWLKKILVTIINIFFDPFSTLHKYFLTFSSFNFLNTNNLIEQSEMYTKAKPLCKSVQ